MNSLMRSGRIINWMLSWWIYCLQRDASANGDFKVDEYGVLRFRGRVYVLDNPELKKLILEESHMSSLSIHPGATKVYQDLKKILWWPRMK